MYKILYDNDFLFDPFDDSRVVYNASITNNVNAASYLDFTVTSAHPMYDKIEERSGIITVYWDNEELFQGQITKIELDLDGNKTVACSSALDWLREVQLRPYSTDEAECKEYEFPLDKAPESLDGYFQWVIDQYNATNLDDRRFDIDVNQANGLTSKNHVYFASTSPQTVADAIESNILDAYGGYLVLRYDDHRLVLDLYSDIHEMNPQIIDFAENILDITKTEDTNDQYTAVLPLGKSPQYTAKQQKYHDEKDAYDKRMKERDAAQKSKIDRLRKEEEAERKRIDGIKDKKAKKAAQDALKRRQDARQKNEDAFNKETERLQNEQKIKDDANNADKTKTNPIDISSLPDGGLPTDLDLYKKGDVVYSMTAVERYGYKEYVYTESDVEDKQELLRLAGVMLRKLMAPALSIDVKAIDRALYQPEHTHLFVGQAVRVRSKIHGVDEFMMVSSIKLDLTDPSQTTATLGVAYDTLTGQQSSYLKSLNSQIDASVDVVTKVENNVKNTEITLGQVQQVVSNVNDKTDLVINTVDDYKWMTDTAWGKADDAQEDADKANQGVTDTNIRIDNIKMATDERIDEMKTDISDINTEIDNTKAEVEQAKQTAEQIRQDAQAGIEEAKQQAEDIRTEANTTIDKVKTDLEATEAKAQQAASNASAALGGLSSANTDITNLRTEVDRHTENLTNINGEIVGVRDTISGVAETANSALSVATTNTHAINEQSTRIDTAYSDIETTRTSVSEVKQTADGLKVNLETNYLDKNELSNAYASKLELSATSESIKSTVSKTYATKAALEGLQNIADAAIETWSGQTVPTASNPPASTWTTDALKKKHSGDIYYDMSTGKSYRWGSVDGKVYSWSMIADSDITKAIADAAKAQQTADGAKQDVVNLSDAVKATYTSKSEFKQTSDEIKASVSEVASVNETNTQKIAEVSVKADGISAEVAEQAETINGHTTTIGQLSVKADGLQTKFEQVSTSLDVALANSEELLYNGGFEFGMDGWSCSYADLIKTSNVAHSGMKWARTLLYIKELISTKPIKAIKGRRYRFGVWYKIGNGYTNNYGGLRFQKSTDGTNFSDWKSKDITMEHTSNGDWRYVYVDGVADDTVRFMRARIAFRNTIDIFLDDLSIKDITDAYDNAEKADAALTKSSQLEQNLDGFKQTVSETYTTKTETDDAINGVQIGGTNLSITKGYYNYNVGGLKNFTYTPADDQYDFDVSAAASSGWGHRMVPTTRCADQRRYPWDKWGTCTFDVYAERECTFVTDINNGLADGSGSGNDHDLRSKAKKILPDGSTQLIGANGATQTNITIPAQQWVRIGIMCYNGNQSANPNHADIQDYSSIGFLSLGEDFHVKVRKIKFEVGNKPTEWSPCPLDMLDKASAETTYTTKSEFTQTSSEIRGKVEEQATTINGHTDSIASLSLTAKKFETDISQTSEQVDGILGRTTKLEQDLGGFKQSVDNTYISKTDADKNLVDAINAMQIGGTNMLLDTQQFGQSNPNNVTSGKLININAATGVGDSNLQNTKYSSGFKWRGIPSSNTTNNADGARYSVFVKKGGTYTLSFESMATSDFYVYFYGPNGYIKAVKTIVDGKVVPNSSNGDGMAEFKKSDGVWVRHTITWVLGNNGSSLEKYVLFRRKGSSGYVTILAPKLEEGSKATEWSPSPFDTLLGSAIEKTYASKSLVEQTERRITSTVEQNYASKTQLTDEMKKSVKTIEIRGRMDGNYWWKLGRLTMEQQGKDFHIDFTGGRGYNGETGQNSQLEIHVRSSNGGGRLFGVTVNRLVNADMYQTKAFVIDATHIDLYLKSGSKYDTGTMAYYGQYRDFSGWKQIDDISTAEGTELTVLEQSLSTKSYVDQTANSVAIGVVEAYKNGEHGDKLTTSSQLQTMKDSITSTVASTYESKSDATLKSKAIDGLINPDFTTGTTYGWKAENSTVRISTADSNVSGGYIVCENFKDNSNWNLKNDGIVTVKPKNTYRVSIMLRTQSGLFKDTNYLSCLVYKSDGTTRIINAKLADKDVFTTDNWYERSVDITIPEKITAIRLAIGLRTTSTGYVCLKSMRIEDVTLALAAQDTANKGMKQSSEAIQSLEKFQQSVEETYVKGEDLSGELTKYTEKTTFEQTKNSFEWNIKSLAKYGPDKIPNGDPRSDLETIMAIEPNSNPPVYAFTVNNTSAPQSNIVVSRNRFALTSALIADRTYRFSFEARVVSGSVPSADFIRLACGTDSWSGYWPCLDGSGLSTTWKTFTRVIKVTQNCTKGAIEYNATSTGAKKFYIRNISIMDVTEGANAQSGVNELDTLIRYTSNGIEVGRKTNGQYTGPKALVNSNGSFDVVKADNTLVSRFGENLMGIMRDPTLNDYRYSLSTFVSPAAGGGSERRGVNMKSYGSFMLNGIPCNSATDMISAGASNEASIPLASSNSWFYLKMSLESLRDKTFTIKDAATFRSDYYKKVEAINGGTTNTTFDSRYFDHCICCATANDNSTDTSVTAGAQRQVMITSPGLYGIIVHVHGYKPNTANSFMDLVVEQMSATASSYSIVPNLRYRIFETSDKEGFVQKATPIVFNKFDVGTRLRVGFQASHKGFKLSTWSKFYIVRMPFSSIIS